MKRFGLFLGLRALTAAAAAGAKPYSGSLITFRPAPRDGSVK